MGNDKDKNKTNYAHSDLPPSPQPAIYTWTETTSGPINEVLEELRAIRRLLEAQTKTARWWENFRATDLDAKSQEALGAWDEWQEYQRAKEEKENGAEPLPCPFCGSEAKIDMNDDQSLYWINCDTNECPMGGPDWTRNNSKEAIEAWNKRTK